MSWSMPCGRKGQLTSGDTTIDAVRKEFGESPYSYSWFELGKSEELGDDHRIENDKSYFILKKEIPQRMTFDEALRHTVDSGGKHICQLGCRMKRDGEIVSTSKVDSHEQAFVAVSYHVVSTGVEVTRYDQLTREIHTDCYAIVYFKQGDPFDDDKFKEWFSTAMVDPWLESNEWFSEMIMGGSIEAHDIEITRTFSLYDYESDEDSCTDENE